MQLRHLGLVLFLAVMISPLVLVTGVCADEIPKGVTIQEVTAVSNVPIGTDIVWRDGIGYAGGTTRLQDGSPVKVGDIAVDADYEWTMRFYNVGALGGTQYQKATLTRRWVARDPGQLIITRQQELDENYEKFLATNPKVVVPKPVAPDGELSYKPNPGGKPVFDPEVVTDTLVFTGGPDGAFMEGEIKILWLVDGGKSVTHRPGTDTGVMGVMNPETAWKGFDPTDSGARFSAMTGQVEILTPDDYPDGWKLAKMNSVLPVGTHVRTQEDSQAILSFADTSTFLLKQDSEVVVVTPPNKESKLSLVAGNIWVNVKKMVTDGSMEIEMNQAVAGIKGTTLVCEVKKDGTSTLKVIEGSVEFTAKADGKSVMVAGGSMVSADQKGLGTSAKFDVAAETASWDAMKAGASSGSSSGSSPAPGGAAQTQKSPASLVIVFLAVAAVFGLVKRNWQ